MPSTPRSLRFLAHLAHELRSPLNVIAGSLAELQRAPSAEDRALMLTLSQRALTRLVGLADRLSLAARVEDGLQAALEPLDLVALTRQTLAAFASAELRRRLELLTVYPAEPVMVRADPALLPALLRELLANANRHARRALRVEVLGEGGPAVAVDDDGEGIAPEDRPLLFEPLAERRSRTGVGLGLWLARSLALLQHGALSVEVDRPSGTRQLLKLPPLERGG